MPSHPVTCFMLPFWTCALCGTAIVIQKAVLGSLGHSRAFASSSESRGGIRTNRLKRCRPWRVSHQGGCVSQGLPRVIRSERHVGRDSRPTQNPSPPMPRTRVSNNQGMRSHAPTGAYNGYPQAVHSVNMRVATLEAPTWLICGCRPTQAVHDAPQVSCDADGPTVSWDLPRGSLARAYRVKSATNGATPDGGQVQILFST